ncbi:MAG: FAD:protein FMN transferase, partial [Phycisphaerales bacterium]|nr:FAD:protein FMN transferase [Phycisphaerales bacterium]
GSRAEVTVYAPDEATAIRGVRAAFDRLRSLDAVMSDYRPESELMLICDQPAGRPVEISDDLARVLARATEISRQSEGCFDITVGPIVRLWRPAFASGVRPDADAVRDAAERVSWRAVDVQMNAAGAATVTLKRPDMRLDLGGIGKGFAADEAVRVLDDHGLRRCLVDLGGDVVAGDAPPDDDGWRVRLVDADGSSSSSVVTLARSAVATSGDQYRSVVIGGERYSHIVDPRTCEPVRGRVLVTVTARDGATADAWASAWSVFAGAMVSDAPAALDGEWSGYSAEVPEVTGVRVEWESAGEVRVWSQWSDR